jgi:2-desacetyl-2-hydroxyethyl bacteriochlorophyllide A dehydrogenase
MNHSLIFTAPHQVEVRESPLPVLVPTQVLVQTICSGISAGTELLVYRGEAPVELAADESISSLSGSLNFPLKYGYCAVGKIISCGAEVESSWRDRLVFAFNPHETHFAALPTELIPLPDGLSVDDAIFLPNLETAVNFLHDAAPLLGERVLVFGQGVVGLLTTCLLARCSLTNLITFDRYALRRKFSLACGATQSLEVTETIDWLADLAFELSGATAALDRALALTGFGGRVIVGGQFHRSRIKLMSSQVSTLAPELSARWTKARRFELVLKLLSELKPSRFITHRFKLAQAAQAYELLDTKAAETLQVIFDY